MDYKVGDWVKVPHGGSWLYGRVLRVRVVEDTVRLYVDRGGLTHNEWFSPSEVRPADEPQTGAGVEAIRDALAKVARR